MNYSEALHYLYEQLPMYQRTGPAAYKNNLDNTLALDQLFGHPHREFKTIHVAGTNGKGSVSHMLASVLQSAGYKTGLYTSPHLKDFRERIRINGNMMSEAAVGNFLERFLKLNAKSQLEPSFFELTVLMAFDYFAREKVDVAVIEVGLGGRLDSTNIISPELSVITNISLDHTNLLGNTIEQIAAEKAGIIKKNTTVVVGEYQEGSEAVFKEKARAQDARLVFADQEYVLTGKHDLSFMVSNQCSIVYRKLQTDLKGSYQDKNLLTVIAALTELKHSNFRLPDEAVSEGLAAVTEKTGLQGRWQKIGTKPDIICDTGHNEAGIRYLVQQLSKHPHDQLHIVFGTVNDKDISKIIKLLPPGAHYYFTRANIERALDPDLLAQKARSLGLKGTVYPDVKQAFDAARKNAAESDLIFVGGSTFVVAEVL